MANPDHDMEPGGRWFTRQQLGRDVWREGTLHARNNPDHEMYLNCGPVDSRTGLNERRRVLFSMESKAFSDLLGRRFANLVDDFPDTKDGKRQRKNGRETLKSKMRHALTESDKRLAKASTATATATATATSFQNQLLDQAERMDAFEVKTVERINELEVKTAEGNLQKDTRMAAIEIKQKEDFVETHEMINKSKVDISELKLGLAKQEVGQERLQLDIAKQEVGQARLKLDISYSLDIAKTERVLLEDAVKKMTKSTAKNTTSSAKKSTPLRRSSRISARRSEV